MPRPSFDDAQSLPDPYMTYNFNMNLPKIPGSGADLRAMQYKVQTTMIPGMKIDQVKVPFHGTEINYGGRQVYDGSIEVTILEVRDISTRDAFRKWMEFYRNNNNNSGNYAANVKVNGLLELYDDIPNIVRTIQINGMFPTSVGDMQLDGSQSQAGSLQVTFSYDRHFDLV